MYATTADIGYIRGFCTVDDTSMLSIAVFKHNIYLGYRVRGNAECMDSHFFDQDRIMGQKLSSAPAIVMRAYPRYAIFSFACSSSTLYCYALYDNKEMNVFQ